MEGLRIVQKNDMTMVTSGELYSLLEWTQTLEAFRQLPLNIKVILLKRFAIFHLVIEHGYYTAMNSELDDMWLITNGTCMPRYVEMLPLESQVRSKIRTQKFGKLKN